MKTTHQIAKELLLLPDVPLVVEGWSELHGHELTAVMTEYDPEGEAILIQKCVDQAEEERMRKWMAEHVDLDWQPIGSWKPVEASNTDL